MNSNTKRIWIRGLASAFIGGGASAVSTAGMLVSADPERALTTNFWIVVGMVFFVGGVSTAVAFLAESPIPPTDKG